MQVTGYDALWLMVSASLGIAIAPRYIVRLFVKRLNICEVKLAESWAHRELSLCVRANAELPTAASLLVKHLHKSAKERNPWSSRYATAPWRSIAFPGKSCSVIIRLIGSAWRAKFRRI